MNGLATVRRNGYYPGAYVPEQAFRLKAGLRTPGRNGQPHFVTGMTVGSFRRYPLSSIPYPLTRGLRGLSDFDWPAAVVGIYQAYTASVNQGRADDVYIDYLRDQVHRALYAIRQRIKAGDVSPTVAVQAGQQVIADMYRETGAMPRAQARQRAESYRSVFETNAALNGSEAAFYYGRYNCPESTHTTATGILAADLPNCIALSPATGGTAVPTGVTPGGGTAPPLGTSGAVAGGIFDLLGSVNLLGFNIPVLPVAVIALILLTRK